MVGTYDKWVEYRQEREREENEDDARSRGRANTTNQKQQRTLHTKRVPIGQQGQRQQQLTTEQQQQLSNGHITNNVKELGVALALSSPYMSAPFTRAKPNKAERKKRKQQKKRKQRTGTMANAFPAHIAGALTADAKWKKQGGVRKQIYQNRGNNHHKSKAQGSGARAAAAVRLFYGCAVLVSGCVFCWFFYNLFVGQNVSDILFLLNHYSYYLISSFIISFHHSPFLVFFSPYGSQMQMRAHREPNMVVFSPVDTGTTYESTY
jgi:hypothetical protein